MSRGWVIVGVVEAIALAIGVVLCRFGFVPWYAAPLFLLAPPAICAILLVGAIGVAMSKGENPFQ